ncbi:ATP-binding protein [Patescibacteria group bacterium]|nr:ATP-binding protein [Patescibacteria group bacterium]MCG2702009.1 ATP-binding protein [Candidatus Parcubacteria bacterium]MBU4264824.1 ATP-binding protein [Patescibacteria group bacterium]MBU4389846.1 ATP-binding protein [Patescibacteria group bacterium]MBU4397562.1 ATP-binding protein [Patescibacteria group bacterium]
MKKNKLIILMGLPGAGKSYLSNCLKKKYQAKILSGEDMAVKMFGASKCKAKEYKLVYQTIRQLAKGLLKKGFTVVIDGTNLKYTYRKEIYEEIDWKQTILIYLPIDDKTALGRLEKRGGCDKKTFYEFKKNLEEPKRKEKAKIKIVSLSQDQQKIETTLTNLLSPVVKQKL